jgi:hypothetical protein
MEFLDTCFDELFLNEIKSAKQPRDQKRKKWKSRKRRKNGYKPVLVDLSTLKTESVEIEGHLKALIDEWKTSDLSDFDVTTLYILRYLYKRHSTRFLHNYDPIVPSCIHVQSKNLQEVNQYSTIPQFKHRFGETSTTTVFDLINNFNLHSVPRTARIALVKWGLGEYAIKVYTRVPSVEEVIDLQANGTRCVTLSIENLDSLIEGHRDALSFVS